MKMGYAVVHLAKAKGSDSGTSAHIERKVDPKNADKERTHLNRELIDFPEGVENRTQAIQHRLDNAGLTRKIGTNQVRAIRIMLTGTHEDMAQIEESGNLDNWCNDNLDWLNKTYGNDNVVSAVLHLDEKTPHIHATVVPIVDTERKRRKREEAAKRKYRAKVAHTARLCADEVMSRAKLKEYQNSYAEAMKKYGLERGVDGSEAKHITTAQYYRELKVQSDSIQEDISELQEQKKRADKELSEVKTDISKERLKNSAADVGSKLLDGASSLFGTSKVKRLESENENLRAEIADVRAEIEQVKNESEQKIEEFRRDITLEYHHHLDEFKRKETKLQQEIDRLKETISKVVELVPEMMSHLKFTQLCKSIGFGIEWIRQLINGDEISFKGSIYSEKFDKKFHADGSIAKKYQPDPTKDSTLLIDNKPHDEWFREQHQKQTQTIEPQQRRGRRL